MLDTYNDTMVNFILCISYHNEKSNEGEKNEKGRKRKEGRRRKRSGVEGKRRKDRERLPG